MDQAVPQALEPRALRRAFGRFATGVTIVTAHPPDAKPEGMTANSFASLSLDPPLLPGCLARFECATEALLPGGDHVIMIGRILHAEAEDGQPLVYSAGAFCVPAPHAEGRG